MIEVIAVEMGAAISVLRSIVIKLGERVEEEYIYIYSRSVHEVTSPGNVQKTKSFTLT